jgi:hypothetical protein
VLHSLGAMCHSVFDVNTMLAGASGGCYALIGAHFAIVVMVITLFTVAECFAMLLAVAMVFSIELIRFKFTIYIVYSG